MENELVRFILARIDDDEREIKKINRSGTEDNGGYPSLSRFSAEVAAKREIIGVVQRLLVLRDLPSERPVRDGAVEVLRRMALPWDDHAAYRPEWRPKRSGV